MIGGNDAYCIARKREDNSIQVWEMVKPKRKESYFNEVNFSPGEAGYEQFNNEILTAEKTQIQN